MVLPNLFNFFSLSQIYLQMIVGTNFHLSCFQNGSFWGCWRMWEGVKKAPFPKICHIYPTMMKLGTVVHYVKKIQKYINHMTYPITSADISIFSREISNFCYVKNYRHRLHFNTKFLILLTFFEFLKVFLINMVAILMMSRPS